MTARALAEAVGVSPITISRLENGANDPEEATLLALSRALSYPAEFFRGADIDELPVEAASFRSLSAMTAKERDAALAAGSIAYLFSDWVGNRFNLPVSDVPILGAEASPEAAAHYVRAQWGLGQQPITSMVRLLEAKGVRVFSLNENTQNVDAFSCWRNEEPFVFLNTFKSTERSRFDAAHELGHLVMHRHNAPQESRQAESEADQFASHFLMPHDDVSSRIRFVTSLEELIHAKKRWGVSVAALNYRLHKMGIISDWQNRTFNIEISTRGFRKNEPDGLAPETSSVWPQIFSQLWGQRMTRDHVADDLHLPAEELSGLLFQVHASRPALEKGSELKVVQ